MADAAPASMLGTTLERVAQRTEAIFALALVGIVAILLLPLPAALLSTLIALNIALALLVFLVCVYVKEPLDFNAFPSLLLVTTMLRLGLNVASTKLILLTGTGGAVIEAMGQVVVGGNFVVGVVVFVILLIVQLVVVTKGAGRISEVAARFVLDAMPGKQMAIDADLNAGLISEKEARARRDKIAQEAEFYGAMDGASKFVKGDAIAGLIITIVNIAAGFVIGMAMMGMSAETALKTFAILAIGDGLVSQIPSILITIGAGLLITKTRSDETAGAALAREVFLKAKPLAIAGGVVCLVGLVPGMPLLVFWTIGGGMLALAWLLRDAEREALAARARAEAQAAPPPEPEKPEELLPSDRLGVEIGYRLIPLVDKERGGQLLDRITTLRRQLARDGGLLVPPIRIKDNIQLPPNTYRILVHGQEVARYELHLDRLLAIDGGGVSGPLPGIKTKEPAFGLDAVWIEPQRRNEAEGLGWTVTDPASVFITHLTQVLRAHAHSVLNREDVQGLLTALKKEAPNLVKEIETNAKLGTVQKVLAHLLEERVPINNLEKILEAVADTPNADPAQIAEQARARLGRAIVAPYLDAQGRLNAIIFDPATETRLSAALSGSGAQLAISPAEASALIDQIARATQEASVLGRDVVLLTTAGLRRQVRQVVSRFQPDLAVLSYSEIGSTPVEVVGTVSLPKP
ncbi:MAG: flagellar biosynthesis protein FlhA [Planctomycetota bacterium]|nr:flagellar biosynthesis protein FlhA [Planctomycetota bacterium]